MGGIERPRRQRAQQEDQDRDDYNKQFEADLAADIPAWARQEDERQVYCSVKRTKKVSPLTVIAEKWEDPETFRTMSPLQGIVRSGNVIKQSR
jgi:hypothetical protein